MDHGRSRFSVDCCSAVPNMLAHNATANIMVNSAGSKRRARLTQNWPRFTRWFFSRSSSNSEVIRNPDTTKNTSTPKKPPRIQPNPAWYKMTATTLIARRPSSPG